MTNAAATFDVTGQVAVVTGASSGLGRQFAVTLARAGAKVALAARRLDRLEEVVRQIEAFDGRAGVEQGEGCQAERRLCQNQQRPQGERQQQGAQQRRAQLLHVAGAEGLGREAGGTHAQEAEAPKQETEDHRADRHPADVGGIRQTADHGGIDRAEQRRRKVGDDDRTGQAPHAPVPAGAVVPWQSPGHGRNLTSGPEPRQRLRRPGPCRIT